MNSNSEMKYANYHIGRDIYGYEIVKALTPCRLLVERNLRDDLVDQIVISKRKSRSGVEYWHELGKSWRESPGYWELSNTRESYRDPDF